ncbi:MAG TPA: Uma2 family endonuclease [Gemmatimonadales bacterium]
MATMPAMSVEELLALPEDGLRHELLDGEHVVSPTPRLAHQRAVRELYRVLEPLVRNRDDVELFCVPGDLRLNARTVVEPDLFLLPSLPGPRVQDWAAAPIPLLVVEVLSPSTAARDRGQKRRLYLDAGVEEYWIVDLDARVIERWRGGESRPEILEVALQFALDVGVTGSINLAEFFGEVLR